ncbi:IKK1 [Cordylochernes scorpioides]|uniref:IKK1 n=1 Tax=Cordylochernes scorpioides TaxID=51811 RepID=A0ABY6JXI6_9ARAC|nr:IKK1 [Cordylochernes scorpioides]
MLHTTLVPIDLESSGEFIFIRYHDFCNMGGERLTLQVEQTIRTLSKEGNSYSVIVKKLKAEGLDVGKATICRVVNGIGKKREAESNGQKFQVDRPRPVRTPATVSKVKRLATTENPPSQRQLSRMCGTSLKTINNIIHKDLELDTRRKGKVHKLTPFHMKNRATNARKLYEEHLAGSRSEYTATLDEAWMYVTYCNGIRKICYIKRGNQVPDNWVHQCSETFPKGFMVVGVMTGRGVLPLIKVPSKVKVNSEFYIECVLKPVIEQLKDLYPGEMDKVFLHHDKASSHTSNKTQQFLQEMKDTLGLNFIRNSDIPVKSPDASPLDFYGFGMLKQRLFNRRPKTEAGLWKAAQEEWSNVSLSKVKEVFAAWKVRCREIAKKKGKHIEHMKKIHEWRKLEKSGKQRLDAVRSRDVVHRKHAEFGITKEPRTCWIRAWKAQHPISNRENSANKDYANPPTGVGNANLAVARGDVTSGLPPATSSNGAARALRNWADCPEDQGPGADDDFTVVRTKKRRRESANSPTAAAPSSNIGGARTSRRPQSSAGSVPRAQEVRTTRAHITEARARQASSSEDHCVYLEHGPELQPFHYLRALDRMLGGTAGVIQVSKVNGHQLLGLANRGLAERLINEGLEVEGTLLRAFPFRKRAERITVGNLPFFVEDSAIISALKPYGRVTSIAPKLMKAGPYTYNDGRREAFIVLREGMTTERLPTRLEIPIKGEAWPAYLSSGIKCSRCHGQGHRRANCPLLAGRTNAPRPATPTSPTSVPPVTAPGLPQQPSAHPTPPASSSPAMEIPSASPAARAVTPSAAPRPSTPVAPAVPVEMAPPAPPPVTPAPSLRAPGGSVSPQSTKSGPPAQDIEMTAIEESSASSTSSSRTSMRDDLVAFIQRSPTVSFTGTDALGLGREEVLDLLSSRTKAQRKRGLLTPPQTDALAGLIEQILGLKPAGNTNVYKILHQVKSELKKGPAAVPPTPPLPAPRPAGPTPPVPHGVETKPAMVTPPPPLPTPMEEEHVDHVDLMEDLFEELNSDTELKPLLDSGFSTYDLIEAILHRNERALLIAKLSPSQKIIFAGFIDIVIWRAQHCDNHIRQRLANFRKALNS